MSVCFEMFGMPKRGMMDMGKSELLLLDTERKPIRETPLWEIVVLFPTGWIAERSPLP